MQLVLYSVLILEEVGLPIVVAADFTLVPQTPIRLRVSAILARNTSSDMRAQCASTRRCQTRDLLVGLAEHLWLKAAFEFDIGVLQLWSVSNFRLEAHKVLLYRVDSLVITNVDARNRPCVALRHWDPTVVMLTLLIECLLVGDLL